MWSTGNGYIWFTVICSKLYTVAKINAISVDAEMTDSQTYEVERKPSVLMYTLRATDINDKELRH